MTTPNLPGPERIKSCREFLLYMGENGNLVEKEYAADLLALLDALPALQAENERLREDCDRTADVVVEQMEQIDKLKAELAAARPLIEAAMALGHEGGYYLDDDDIGMAAVAEAALAFREKAEKAGEKGEGK